MLGFQSFHTATKTLAGIEAMHIIRKGRIIQIINPTVPKKNIFNCERKK